MDFVCAVSISGTSRTGINNAIFFIFLDFGSTLIFKLFHNNDEHIQNSLQKKMKFQDHGWIIDTESAWNIGKKKVQVWFSEASSMAFRKTLGARVGLLVSLLTKTSTREPVHVFISFSL